mgnify:CR=1 FL=1
MSSMLEYNDDLNEIRVKNKKITHKYLNIMININKCNNL